MNMRQRADQLRDLLEECKGLGNPTHIPYLSWRMSISENYMRKIIGWVKSNWEILGWIIDHHPNRSGEYIEVSPNKLLTPMEDQTWEEGLINDIKNFETRVYTAIGELVLKCQGNLTEREKEDHERKIRDLIRIKEDIQSFRRRHG